MPARQGQLAKRVFVAVLLEGPGGSLAGLDESAETHVHRVGEPHSPRVKIKVGKRCPSSVGRATPLSVRGAPSLLREL